jgi:ELWxxDGT repeat protein
MYRTLLRTVPPLLAALAAAVPAAAQSQLADLFPTASTGVNSGGSEFTVFANGTRAVFRADGAHGEELYVTDGTPAGTVLLADLTPNGDSLPFYMCALGNEVLFRAKVPGLGYELWKTDGTPAGTVLVKDIYPGSRGSNPSDLCRVGNVVYFAANDSQGENLWRSDGTAAGTFLVANITPGPGAFVVRDLTAVDNRVFFVADDGTHGDELYVSDGTAAGTVLVADLTPGPADTDFENLGRFGDKLVFSTDVQDGHEPWISDGTAAGTFRLADLEPGANGSDPEQWVVVGNDCLFVADGPSGEELYLTDGTSAGTALLADINPGTASSGPRDLTSFGNYAVFYADGPDGAEPYRTNGTTAGTYLIADLVPGGSSYPGEFVQVGNVVWFTASDPVTGTEIYQTDGSAAGTFLLANFLIGPQGLRASRLAAFGNGVLCWSEIAGVYNDDPTFCDGTIPGTFLLADIQRNPTDSDPGGWTRLDDGRIVFAAAGGLVGRELHVTDGTSAGTQLVADVVTGPTDSNPEWLTPRGDEVFFAAEVAGLHQLFVADTLANTFAQMTNAAIDLEPRHLVRNGNRVLFHAAGPDGRELWRSNGTVAGTSQVSDVMPGPADGIDEDAVLVTLGGLTFFAADDGVHGVELWVTDGSPAGTQMVVDLEPGIDSSEPDEMIVFDGVLYFAADAQGYGRELWRTDGTAAGTMLAADVAPGVPSSSPEDLAVGDGRLFFVGTPGGAHRLFGFDGSTATELDIFSGLPWDDHAIAAAAGGVFYVNDDDSGSGLELWFSDGTIAGTAMVADIGPGLVDGPIEGTLTPMLGGSQLLFAASDLHHGLQLWRSDGTAANTVPVTSFGGTGFGAGFVGELLASGTFAVFGCDEGVTGIEPWVLDAEQEDLPFVLPFGDGCATPGTATPKIGALGMPTLANPSFAVTVERAPAGTIAVPAGANLPAQLPLANGCTIWIAPPPILLSASFTNASGRAMTPVPVPNDPLLLGGSVFFQWAVFTPGGPFLGDFSLSGGLHVQIGS